MHGWDALRHPVFYAAVARDARQDERVKDNLYQEGQLALLMLTGIWIGFGVNSANPLWLIVALGTFEIFILAELMIMHSSLYLLN